MHRWPTWAKGLLLAAMLLPFLGLLAGGAALAVVFSDDDPDDALLVLGFVAYFGAFALMFGAALGCVLDLFLGDRIVGSGPRALWTTALLLAASFAGPAYWWLYVRPPAGRPYGLGLVPPARGWSRPRKAASGAAVHALPVIFVAWIVWLLSLEVDRTPDLGLSLAVVGLFAAGSLLGYVAITLFVLDAVREGDDHAILWGLLLALLSFVAAPVYWWMHVRPSAASSDPLSAGPSGPGPAAPGPQPTPGSGP